MAIELGAAYISILPSTSKLAPAIRKEMGLVESQAKRAGSRSGDKFGSNFKSSLARWTKRGLLAGVAGVGLLGAAGLKTASDLEQSKIGFETMLGSAEKADAFLGKIKDTAAKTPFELNGLTKSAQKLLAFGFEAKEVIPTLTTLGDASSGLGLGIEGLDRITLALGQIKAKGRVQGGEILQLTEAGIPAMRILQNELGLTADEYDTMQRKGQIAAEDALPALLRGMDRGTKGLAGKTAKFGGLMEKQSQSLAGLVSTFKDTVLIGMADALEPLLPMLKEGLTSAIENVGPALEKGSKAFAGFIEGMKDGTGAGGDAAETFRSISSVVKPIAKAVIGTVKAFSALPGSAQKVLILAAAAFALKQKFGGALPSMQNFTKEAALAGTKSLALRGGALAAGAGLATLASKAGGTSTKLGALATVGAGAATGFAVGGPWGAAIGGGVGLLSALTSSTKTATRAQSKFGNGADSVAETLDRQTGALTKLTRATVAKELADKGVYDAARIAGISIKDVTNAALGNVDAQGRVNDALSTGAKGNKNMSANAVLLRDAIGDTTKAIEKERKSIDQVREAMDKTNGKKAKVTVTSEGIGKAISGLRTLKDLLSGIGSTTKVNNPTPGMFDPDQNAKGTDNFRGGMTWVGEKGPELINLRKGAQIIPNHKIAATAKSVRGSGVMAVAQGSSMPSSMTLKVGDKAFTAYVSEVAGDAYNGNDAFAGMTRRMT